MPKKNAQIATDYTFLKSPWPSKFKCANTFENIQNLNMYSRKTENVKFPLKASVQKAVQNIFAKFLQSACCCYRLSKELCNVEIEWPEVGLNVDLVWYR